MSNYYHLLLDNWVKTKELEHQARENALREEALTLHKCEYDDVKPKRPRWHFFNE